MRNGKAIFGITIGALLLAACHEPVVDRSGRLLEMAGKEAAGISNTLDRFTRQLNIANTQVRTLRNADALQTLKLAHETLAGAKRDEIDDFHRIAGWTAISQLSRQAGDREMALAASDQAQAALNDVQPVAQRPQYVLSLATELQELRGTAAAVELLDSGGAWAADIQESPVRRRALAAFAYRLLTLDAFDDAQSMLRRDPDPAWRTDEFLALANRFSGPYLVSMAGSVGGRGGTAGPAAVAFAPDKNESGGTEFGKDVRFESVFQK